VEAVEALFRVECCGRKVEAVEALFRVECCAKLSRGLRPPEGKWLRTQDRKVASVPPAAPAMNEP
jgi:hypothetical protein